MFWNDFAKEAVRDGIPDSEYMLERSQKRIANLMHTFVQVQAPQAKEVVDLIQQLGQTVLNTIEV